MNPRKWIAPSIALLIVAAVKCGGDDTNSTPPNGNTTSTGAGGTGTNGGSAGTSNAGTAGDAGSGGVGMGGSGGSAGSGGNAGNGGSAGTGGGGGAAGAAGNGGAAGMGGAAGAVDAGTDGSSEAGDARVDVVADTARDAAVPDADAAVGDAAPVASTCPMTAPVAGTACVGTISCTYGTGFCRCRTLNGMQSWQCMGDVDAANTEGCPPAAPTTGTSCADAGPGLLCNYINGVNCTCTTLNGDTWQCF